MKYECRFTCYIFDFWYRTVQFEYGDAVEEWIEQVVQEFCVSRNDWKEFTDGIEASLNDKT